ncbi:MAG TPA: hypothetical protein VLX91_09840 [Candidatus Acidoferrales bacterium]|nr:hypothetical protein [Candidatus Acidoferrales bacterium]
MISKGFNFLISLILMSSCGIVWAQSPTTTIRLGHLWFGMPGNGGPMNVNIDPSTSFFPNDYGIMADRGQYPQAFTGAGIVLAVPHWHHTFVRNKVTIDTVEIPAVYSYINTYLQNGRIIGSLTNYLRYNYPSQTINGGSVPVAGFGTYNPSYSGFTNTTADEIADVVDSSVFGVTVDRKVLVWSQSYNNDYAVGDFIFTNVLQDTLDSLYINLQETAANAIFSNGNDPAPLTNETYDPTISWQHYYGGRPGDSLRVFFEYSADDPAKPGDNMGAPVGSSNGRLIAPNMTYYAILHASQPYDSTNPSGDQDDASEPAVTYSGVSNVLPYVSSDDQYGNKNFFAVRGAFSDMDPMTGEIAGSHHCENPDEIGISSPFFFPSAERGGVSYRTCSFGPYTFYPGQKIHIVIASGFTGIGFDKGKEVGDEWLHRTLQDPPNMPDPNTGWLPPTFQFPTGATEFDKSKDRWISMGIDSVMLSASRAKWNYDHGYQIPQAPPPPQAVSISYTSHADSIMWSDPQAESMPNFAGYRIMRRISAFDTVAYVQVYDSDSTDVGVSHFFIDSTAMYLANAYYYVQSKARIGITDPNADPTTRGKIIYSGRTLYPNTRSIPRPGPAQNDLSKIRIVPNPYNVKDPLQVVTGRLDPVLAPFGTIAFFNLPSVCTIKIYTENGDLVYTINHNQKIADAGTEQWNLLTSSQQVAYSGVYIAVFQKPDGETSFQKFIIVR